MRTAKLILILVCLIEAASAQPITTPDAFQNELSRSIRAHAHPIRFPSGELAGPGAELLAAAMRDVQFVALGEVHSRRAMHQFGGALFRMLHGRFGFNYLALEEDPHLGHLSSAAARKGGADEMIRLALRYPNAFHLLTEEELRMIGEIGQISKAKGDPVWGLNQVFGAAHILERLVEIAPNATARVKARELLSHALEYEGERFRKNVSYMGTVAKPADFELLRTAYRPAPGSEADQLIEQLTLSNRVFAPYSTKPRPAPMVFFRSNTEREGNMKRLFADRYREAHAKGDRLPKVLAMFGQLHLYRGLSEQTDLFTLGNFLSELAVFNGKSSFHIYTMVEDPSARAGWQGPIVQAIDGTGGPADEGVLVDLRPLREFAIARNPDSAKLDPRLRRLILGFDAYLFLRDGAPGSWEKFKTPNFRLYPD